MADKPQWQGVTLYLVTTNDPNAWTAHDNFAWAARDMSCVRQSEAPHVWEVQIGREPVDVTDEARKLVEGK